MNVDYRNVKEGRTGEVALYGGGGAGEGERDFIEKIVKAKLSSGENEM